MTIVEAFQSDVPVICSNTTSMPKVAGNTAWMIDPFSVNDIAEKMNKLWSDPILRKEFIEKGRIQNNIFTWKRTSELLYKSICSCLES